VVPVHVPGHRGRGAVLHRSGHILRWFPAAVRNARQALRAVPGAQTKRPLAICQGCLRQQTRFVCRRGSKGEAFEAKNWRSGSQERKRSVISAPRCKFLSGNKPISSLWARGKRSGSEAVGPNFGVVQKKRQGILFIVSARRIHCGRTMTTTLGWCRFARRVSG
jgi:hypothetical protein